MNANDLRIVFRSQIGHRFRKPCIRGRKKTGPITTFLRCLASISDYSWFAFLKLVNPHHKTRAFAAEIPLDRATVALVAWKYPHHTLMWTRTWRDVEVPTCQRLET